MKKYSFDKSKSLTLFNTHGCDYSKLDLILMIIGFLIATSVICILHKLQIIYVIIVGITVLVSLPFIISSYFMYKSEKRRFDEFCTYFEYMKLYYKVHKKIIISLKETVKVFDETSKIKEYIEQAIIEIETTGDYKKALSYIDDKYHNTYLERLHFSMILGETQGGESVIEGIDMILYDDWKEDMVLFQKKKKSARNWFYFLALLSLGTSAFAICVFNGTEFVEKIAENGSYQLFTIMELEILLAIFVYIYTSLVNKKWIRSDE